MTVTVAIIPARGGSKRIPRKNVREFAGLPMIAHSIRVARECGLFDSVIVSTDDAEIAAVAEVHGAECPFTRPPELSDDNTPTAPVLRHALEWLAAHGQRGAYACCIYATAPFLRQDDLREGLRLIGEKRAGSALAVTSFDFPIFRAFQKQEDGSLSMFWPENELVRSQDLPEAYHDAGQFYWVDTDRFAKEPRLFFGDSVGVVLPRYRVQDIDVPEDWERAELMHKLLGAQGRL